MRTRAEFAAALVVQLIGAAAVLLVSTRDWQTVHSARPRPFTADVLGLSGRTVDSAPTALALVALAGVVAVLATKGIVRRVVGALVAVAGAAIIWRSAQACAAVSAARAHDLVRDKHPRVSGSAVLAQQVSTHLVWGLLSIAGGVLVLVAGVWIAWRGGHWGAMSARYDAPVAGSARPGPDDAERAQSRADAALWTALEHGEDPTADDPGRSR